MSRPMPGQWRGPYRNDDPPEADALDEWIAAAPMPLYPEDIRRLELMYAENTAKDDDDE